MQAALPKGKTALVACEMVEDEVRAVLRRHAPELDVDWVERGFHDHPDRLREELQGRIDRAERAGAEVVLLAFGLCGMGAVGLCAERAVLAMPRFDDCVNMLLFRGERAERALAEAGVLYLTAGWTKEGKTVLGQREAYVERFGKRRADRVMELMYDGYRAVSVIDDGCFELGPTREYAHACARLLGLGERVEPGSVRVLEKLVTGEWDENILVKRPGERVGQFDFDIEPALWEAPGGKAGRA